ncbi:MAG: undecaprenyldiphospho-muramoylpentapeptide beta-N-acetylglucosaminyltransferase [Actinomycetota bacterium]
MNIVLAGGGTAGHVNPALALAVALNGHEVAFVGTSTGAEARLVPAAGWPFAAIEVRGFDRSRPASIFPVGYVAMRAVLSARRILQDLAADVVVGMGGYVSLPVCLAARALRVPIVLHEQNIVFGLANRVCKPFARRIAVSFQETLAHAGSRGVHVGNPVAPEIAHADRSKQRSIGLARFELEPGRKTLLVFGGSQGARRVNDAALELAELWNQRRDRQLLHIAGTHGLVAATRAPEPDGLVLRVVDFVDHMVQAYAVADLALCRGGATTIAELGAVGLPAIIVPYPYHRDKQQQLHAEVLERAGAAVVIDDSDATGECIAREVDRLFADEASLAGMGRASAALGMPEAAERLASVVLEAAA